MYIRSLVALTLLAACASTPNKPAATTPTPIEAPAPIAPGTPIPAPPWIFLEWGETLVVSAQLDERWLDGPPQMVPDHSYQAHRTLKPSPDLAAARALIGTELKVLVLGPGDDCRIRLTEISGLAWADPEEDDLSAMYRDDDVELTSAQQAEVLWKVGRKVLAARYEWVGEACERPFLAAPAALYPTELTHDEYEEEPVDKALVAAALALAKGHTFWDVQEDAYQESLALAKKHKKALSEEGYNIDWPKPVPKHWDSPRAGSDYSKPALESWKDPSGKALFHVLQVGNDLACDAPRAWFLLDGALTVVLRFGVEWGPEQIIDLDRDGTWELARTNYMTSWVEAMTSEGSDRARIYRENGPVPSEPYLHCAWEQVPPRARIQDVLKPKPPSPDE